MACLDFLHTKLQDLYFQFLEFMHPHLGEAKEDYKKMISKDSHDESDADKNGIFSV